MKQTIEDFIMQSEQRSLLRLSTAGSVDDGKSTLIGRLLFDTKSIYTDTIEQITNKNSSNGKKEEPDFALLTDGLKSEREQKITIDVAYRYFSTPNRNFILADTPGHEQYTRNMATGASNAHAALILIDATKGVITQTKRHSFILSLLGVKHIVVAINKMDLVDYSEKIYSDIKKDYLNFSSKLNLNNIRFTPISALMGDNVVDSSKNMPWFRGETILNFLENVYVDGDRNLIDLRLPIQSVIRPDQNFRGYTGQITSGVLKVGDEITVLPSLQKAKVSDIVSFDGPKKQAFTPQSITFCLDKEIDISRGDMVVHSNNIPIINNEFESMLVWMSEEPLNTKKNYLLKHTTIYSKAKIQNIKYKTNVNTLHREQTENLKLNEIGRVKIQTNTPLFYDSYNHNRLIGSFILIDNISNNTVAAGMIIVRNSFNDLKKPQYDEKQLSQIRNITKEEAKCTTGDKESLYGFKAQTIWLTGLSGSGKSTLAKYLEQALFTMGKPVVLLDGDNVRFGLNRDLGFSAADRKENIRRIAEVAKLFNNAGITVITAFISPFKQDRENAEQIIGKNKYKEVYISTDLKTCEARDPKGLYKKARSGEILQFTGISSPFEAPTNPTLFVDTEKMDISQSIELILSKISF